MAHPAAIATPQFRAAARKGPGLSFTERHRLEELPGLIERLEVEIGRLSDLLSDSRLYEREPVKFQKASEALLARQANLEAAEAEWMALEERAAS